MADNRQQTVKESKGIRNRLKKAMGLGSRSTPQSRPNSPSTVVAPPVVTPAVTIDGSQSTPQSRPNSPSAVVAPPVVTPAVMIDPEEAAMLRAKYTHFRILVIGRANAGKTTLLKRVCNTTEEPSIYDKGKNLLNPTSKRGIHDVHRSFTFKSNPGFIFHDSPGFEAGGEEELEAVMTFIQERSKAKEVDDQIHVIWFCFEPNVSRPLLPLEAKFFDEDRAWNVPVVAVFMKFDDLITQVFDRNKKPEENMNKALNTLEKKFKQPLTNYKFPPRAYVRFKAIHKDEGNHQEQVGELIKQTAASMDNLALKMLFVTVQQNNLEVCIEYAVNKYIFETDRMLDLIWEAVIWFGHCYLMNHNYGENEGRRAFEEFAAAAFGREARGRFGQFAYDISKIVSTQFNMPSLYAFIAILICLEHSFWLTRQGSSPTEGFTEAFNIYLKDKHALLNQKLEVYLTLKKSNDWFTMKLQPSQDECTEFRNIVLDNLLSHPKPSI